MQAAVVEGLAEAILAKISWPVTDEDAIRGAVTDVLAAVPDSAQGVPADWVPVRYIGRRDAWEDRVYGSTLAFSPGQVRAVPPDLARMFLRHPDLFAPAEAAEPDDTGTVLAQVEAKTLKQERALHELRDLIDQIDRMDKVGLMEFAKVNYRQDLPQRMSKADMQTAVRQMVDQFGPV